MHQKMLMKGMHHQEIGIKPMLHEMLQSLAIRILSQVASSSSVEINWIYSFSEVQ
jgi:hypothetical protein